MEYTSKCILTFSISFEWLIWNVVTAFKNVGRVKMFLPEFI